MNTWLLALLLACGSSTPPVEPAPAPVAAPAPAPAPEQKAPPTPKTPAPPPPCPAVFTANDATTMYGSLSALEPVGDCKFEDVHVMGSDLKLAFETTDGTKAPMLLQPLSCLEAPPEGAVVNDPYVLSGFDEAKKLCPEGVDAVIAAVKAGSLPPPSMSR